MPETAIRVSDPSLLQWYRSYAETYSIPLETAITRALVRFRESMTASAEVPIQPPIPTLATAAPPMVPTYNEDLF